MNTAKRKMGSYVPVALWAFVTIAWLIAYLIPGARWMMLDMGASFLLNLLVAGLLWHASRRCTETRTFWRLLALGWGLNLVGNVAWGIYDMVTGRSLPPLSWLDVLYVTRYALVMIALWRCANESAGRRWTGLIAFVSAATAIAWLGLFRPTLNSVELTAAYLQDFAGVAIYLILDFALLYLAVLAWARATKDWRIITGLIALAIVSYGVANLINFSIRLGLPETTAFLTGLLWPLSDALTGLAAVCATWRDPGASTKERKFC